MKHVAKVLDNDKSHNQASKPSSKTGPPPRYDHKLAYELFTEKHLSTRKIGKMMGVSHVAIFKNLKKFRKGGEDRDNT